MDELTKKLNVFRVTDALEEREKKKGGGGWREKRERERERERELNLIFILQRFQIRHDVSFYLAVNISNRIVT